MAARIIVTIDLVTVLSSPISNWFKAQGNTNLLSNILMWSFIFCLKQLPLSFYFTFDSSRLVLRFYRRIIICFVHSLDRETDFIYVKWPAQVDSIVLISWMYLQISLYCSDNSFENFTWGKLGVMSFYNEPTLLLCVILPISLKRLRD